ncbi:MAG: tol-pal system protein YbgF [Gammaproteobacteria bacterium]|nr:tol-pal system protein YbgF [Gammaproteobacteria bacterium]
MTARHLIRIGVLLTAAVYAAAASAAREGSLEYRVERIETLMQSQGLIDMLTQLQQLQREVQQLRGDVELQGHQLQEMQQQQRDLYLDIDRRLQGSQPVGAVTPTVPTTPATDIPPVPATPAADAALTPPPAPVIPQQATVATPDEQAAYEQALNILREGRYADAAQAYQQFLVNYPNGRYADNAQYWLAETQYVTRQFQSGLDEFGKVVSLYPNSLKVPDAQLKMGYIHYEMGNWKAAREQLETLVQLHPDSTAARLASERLQRMSREKR